MDLLSASQQRALQHISRIIAEEEKRTDGADVPVPKIIGTVYDVYEVRDAVEQEQFRSRVAPLEAHVRKLTASSARCDQLLGQVDDALSRLTSLRAQHAAFSGALGTIRRDVNALRTEREQLSKDLEALRAVLQPFNTIDEIVRNLLQPGVTVSAAVHGLQSLARIGPELERAVSAGVRDASVYALRLQQSRARALGILRSEIVSRLQAAQASALHQDRAQTQEAFLAIAPQLRPVVAELESHVDSPDGQAVLQDVRQAYVQSRMPLVMPAVQAALAPIIEGDFDTLLRTGSMRIAGLSKAEHTLAAQIFAQPDEAIAPLQEHICGQLYDAVRPRLIRSTALERLAAAIDALRDFAEDDEHGPAAAALFRRLLADAQERFIFRASSFIHEHVARSPVSQLRYPALLQETPRGAAPFAPVDAAATLLQLAAGRVEPQVFTGLARDVIVTASGALQEAATQIARSAGGIDGQLFAVRQWLRLRDAVQPFGSRIASTEELNLDFSGVREAVSGIFRGRSLFALSRQHPLLNLARSVQLTSAQVDPKEELEKALQDACNAVIVHVTRLLLDPALVLLSSPPTALADDARCRQVAEQVSSNLRTLLPALGSKIALYVGGPATGQLLQAIGSNIVDTTERLRAALSVVHDAGAGVGIADPAGGAAADAGAGVGDVVGAGAVDAGAGAVPDAGPPRGAAAMGLLDAAEVASILQAVQSSARSVTPATP